MYMNMSPDVSGVGASPAECHQNAHESRIGPRKPLNSDIGGFYFVRVMKL